MKIYADASRLSAALALAAALTDDRRIQKTSGLAAVQLTTDGAVVKVTTNVLDHTLTIATPATVEAPGMLAVSAAQLAALVGALPAMGTVEISTAAAITRVICGRSRFQIPTISLEQLPTPLRLGKETGRVELAREEALALFVRPLFAAANDDRFYLKGIFLHNNDKGSPPSPPTDTGFVASSSPAPLGSPMTGVSLYRAPRSD